MDEDDDEFERSAYENGHWIWCEEKNELIFKRNDTEKTDIYLLPETNCGAGTFQDDMDVLQQARYQKRMQRKSEGDDDVIFLQDVKDLVLYTAPLQLLSYPIICIFHLPITERFLRALILYCQYYMETDELMVKRNFEAKSQIPTENTKIIEEELQKNLQDLRLLLFKEYAELITGSSEFSKFHHMGHGKKSKSLSKNERILFETILVVSIQIVWITLDRQWYNQIEHEVHRLMKSDRFNVAEHRQCGTKKSSRELAALRGDCLKWEGKLYGRSPLFHEFSCQRDMDYRIYGIGTIKYKTLDERLRYLEAVLTMPESQFLNNGITLGIIGLRRNNFDISLKPITRPLNTSSASSHSSAKLTRLATKSSRTAGSARASDGSKLSSMSGKCKGEDKLNHFPNIYLPEKQQAGMPLPEKFPMEEHKRGSICEVQRRKWILRYKHFVTRRRASSKNRSILL